MSKRLGVNLEARIFNQQHFLGRTHSGSPQLGTMCRDYPFGGCRRRRMEAELIYEHYRQA